MINKILNKRILGLFIFIFAFIILDIYSPIEVLAESAACTAKRNELEAKDGEKLKDRYGVSFDYNINSKNYELVMNKLNSNSTLYKKGIKNPKFKISKIRFFTPVGENQITKKYDGASYTTDEQIKEFVDNGTISASTITPGKTVKMKKSGFGTNKFGMEITLVPVGFEDYELSAACCPSGSSDNCKTDFDIVLDVVVEAYTSQSDSKVYQIGDTTSSVSVTKIDCNNYASRYDKNSFDYNFCRDKENANNDSDTRKFNIQDYTRGSDNILKYETTGTKKTYGKDDYLSFKCDYNKMAIGVSTDDSEYYLNKKYVIGEGTFEITEGDYVYHTECETKTVPAKCEIKCEEVVTVEYGPPVASKAGLCFEYKVKVTSRVNCGMESEPTKPTPAKVCTPTPVCVHKSGMVHTVGGPNEEFDDCVESCDGGKYTDKCTNKCYKKVYGTGIVKNITGNEIAYIDKLNAINTATVQKLISSDEAKNNSTLYTYTCDKSNADVNKQIVWRVAGADNGTTDTGRYYSNYGATGAGGVNIPTDPFYHIRYGWSSQYSPFNTYRSGIPSIDWCTGKCYWEYNDSQECLSDDYIHYLNDPAVYSGAESEKTGVNIRKEVLGEYYNQYSTSPIEADTRANEETYNKLKARCEAYASCNTTTAEFTVSVDYTTKDSTKVKTIDFPFSTKKDTIKYNNTNSTSCTIENSDSVILNSAGCYDCNKATSQRLYQTEWSFPGSWIHNKTGEVTYDSSKVTTKSWQKQEDKFCLPLNISNVNDKWYNYYYAKVHGNDKNISYNNSEYTKNITCPDGTKLTDISCDYKNSNFTSDDAKNINYNILAKAKKFGMFGWNISISCFYAVNDQFPGTNEKECIGTCEPNTQNTQAYRIREYDPSNMFPDAEGNKLTNPNTTGRTPGFNWSSYSNQTIKDEEYKSQPAEYVKWIQTKGKNVYSDEYLDYEVQLTKELIGKLQKKDKNYTAWDGDTSTNSVVNYQSPLFRNGGILSGTSKYPNTQALQCNNMKNYKSSECQEFTGEVK